MIFARTCRHCGSETALAGTMRATASRDGLVAFQCTACRRLAWRDLPALPAYRLPPLSRYAHPAPVLAVAARE
ncbi:MAG: hypothetical protein Q8M26_12795 [Pseudolabrys sp.]|nr:hypothetical protein [Pseudolabrys sp.]